MTKFFLVIALAGGVGSEMASTQIEMIDRGRLHVSFRYFRGKDCQIPRMSICALLTMQNLYSHHKQGSP